MVDIIKKNMIRYEFQNLFPEREFNMEIMTDGKKIGASRESTGENAVCGG